MTYEFKQMNQDAYVQMRDETMAYYISKKAEYTFHKSKKREEAHEGWETHYLLIIKRAYHFDDMCSEELNKQSIRVIAPYGVTMREIEWDLYRHQPAIYKMLTGIRSY